MADSFYLFKTMVTELLVVWVVGVVSFFVLWAILAKVIKRISERKHKDDTAREDTHPRETMPDKALAGRQDNKSGETYPIG